MVEGDFDRKRLHVVVLDELRKGQHVFPHLDGPLVEHLVGDVLALHKVQQDDRHGIEIVPAIDNQTLELRVHERSVSGGEVAFLDRALRALLHHPFDKERRCRHCLMQKGGHGRVEFHFAELVFSAIVTITLLVNLKEFVRRLSQRLCVEKQRPHFFGCNALGNFNSIHIVCLVWCFTFRTGSQRKRPSFRR